MKTSTQEVREDLNALAHDARALIAATAHVAEDTVVDARHRLESALERAKGLCGQVRDQACVGARTANHAVHEHPYPVIGAAAGAGLLLGYFLSRRSCGPRE
jgi:ElaB/YqjD/DUF883 family membrane-anchored ribosome-binding protein